MILEPITCLTDWLAGTTLDYTSTAQGINARLALIPLRSGDTRPATITTIVDETRNAIAARGRLTETYPQVVVMQNGSAVLDATVLTSVRDADLPVVIRLALKNVESDDGGSALHYYLRALEQSVYQFFRDANVSARTEGSVVAWFLKDLQTVPIQAEIDDTILVTGMVLTIRVRDTAPF